MRIALSVDALSPNLTGIGRYCWELSERLPLVPDVRRVTCFRGVDLIRDPAVLLSDEKGPKVRFHKMRRQWDRRLLRWGARSGIVHGPNFFLPDWVERGVVTVHDLSVFRYPEAHPAERIAAFEKNFARSIGRAGHILTDSETIRRELIAFAGLSEAQITAVPLGVTAAYRPRPMADIAPIRRRLGLPTGGYGLCVSTLEPRKRIGCLLAAWRGLRRDLRDRFPLVLAGANGWKNGELHTAIDRAAAEGWLYFLGYVAEADLPLIYAGASVFAYPSIYEGFGLPPLEAMACGVPTIVARGTCLEEVTKGAAELVDPEDIDVFSAAITRALEDEVWRCQAISSGIRVAADYTWDRCAERTVDAYRKVAG